MSGGDSSKPPKGGSTPGMVGNRGGTVLDAIPTEEEGDALFDELFGDAFGEPFDTVEDDASSIDEDERPTHESIPAGAPPAGGVAPAGPSQEAEAAEEDTETTEGDTGPTEGDPGPTEGDTGPTEGIAFDEPELADDDRDTAPPPEPGAGQPAEPTLAEMAAEAAAAPFVEESEDDFAETNRREVPDDLPPPPPPAGDADDFADTSRREVPEDLPPPPTPGMELEPEPIPYAEPYDVPPVEPGAEGPTEETKPGPSVIPEPPERPEGYQRSASEPPLERLGEPAPDQEEIVVPEAADREPLVEDEAVEVGAEEVALEEPDEAIVEPTADAEDVALGEEVQLDDELDEAARRSLDELASIPPPLPEREEEEGVAVSFDENIDLAEEGEGLDAVVSLMQQGQRDAWLERAHWLYDEAPEEPRARASALLLVSELLAMGGEDERAETVAREALELAPNMPMAHRQLRGMLMARGRWTETVDALDAEAKVAATTTSELHASCLGAEVCRLALGDPDGAHRRLEHAERLGVEDVRPALASIMETLAAEDAPPSEVPEPFAEAGETIRTLRSDGSEGEAGTAPHALMLRARSALRRRNMTPVVAGLRVLAEQETLERPASWLIASIGAARGDLRNEAFQSLEKLSDGPHGSLATRARIARALELGEHEAARRIAMEADESVLRPAERIVVAALSGDPAAADAWRAQIEGETHLPVALAALGLADPTALSEHLTDPAQQNVAIGRLLAAEASRSATAVEEELGDAVVGGTSTGLSVVLRQRAEALLDAEPDNGIARALLLEQAHAIGEGEVVARMLAGDAVSRERALFAAMLSELADDRERMAENLERAMADAPADPAAMRMSMSISDPMSAATSLVRYADVTPEPVQAGIALTEAGLRLMEIEGQEMEGEALLRRAAEQQPELPIAPFIGMYIAQALEDVDGERFWLEQRRAAAPEPGDAVPDLIRQALRLPGDDAERTSLLEEAHRNRPDDFALRDLYEGAAGVTGDRAAWLMERVEDGGPEAAPAALEAALAAELDGDVEQASSCVAKALELGDRRLAPLFAERYAASGQNVDAVVQRLESEAEAAEDTRARVELRRHIARIELLGRGDHERASESLRSALAEAPDDLLTLHAIAALCRREGTTEGLGGVALAIARQVPGPIGGAHAALAARLLTERGKWEDTYEPVRLAYAVDPPDPWALRQMEAHAAARGEHETAAEVERRLAAEATTEADAAILMVRAAEHTLALEDEEGAAELLREALDRAPRHPIALLERAAQLERIAEPSDAAQAWEELGLACQSSRERAAKLYKAATLWLSTDSADGRLEARRLLEAVAEVDPSYADTFDRLREIYLAAGDKRELADLLATRIDSVEDPNERMELEVLRGKTLVEAGSPGEARDALAAALEANPDNAEALRAFADVCEAEEDWEGVERAIISLGRLLSEPDDQVAIHLRLGALYSEQLPNPERAQAAFEAALERQPDNFEARRRLVRLHLDAGDTDAAFAAQEKLVEAAQTQSAKCQATVQLAEIHEVTGDTKEAEQVLVKARRQFSKEPAPVEALYHFYQRTGQDKAAEVLLERAAADVRRGLGAGRFEAPLFEMATMVAEMRGQQDTAEIAQATLAAIRGEPTYVQGCGPAAGDPALDELIAPDLFDESFRNLLKRTGALMDAGASFDISGLRAKPLPPPHEHVLHETQELAAAYGLPDVQVYATNALDQVCLPAQSSPATLCFGLGLVTSEDTEARRFLVQRALKILQTGTAALSRTAPIDLWPLFAAYLKVHSPSFTPQGVDAQKVATFHQRMSEIGVRADPQLSILASDVIGKIGNRASSLNNLVNAWGSRAALLSMGDPNVALRALAFASGASTGPPAEGAERLRWIGRQAEARDLVVFSVSEGYAQAREKLGLEEPVESIDADEVVAIDVE